MGQPVGCNHCHLAARVEEDMLPSFCSASVLLLPPCMACAPCPSTRLSAQRRHRRRSRHQCCLRAHQPSGHAVTPTAVGCEYTEVRIIVRSIRFAILPWGKRAKRNFARTKRHVAHSASPRHCHARARCHAPCTRAHASTAHSARSQYACARLAGDAHALTPHTATHACTSKAGCDA